jgi:hypothetical protein
MVRASRRTPHEGRKRTEPTPSGGGGDRLAKPRRVRRTKLERPLVVPAHDKMPPEAVECSPPPAPCPPPRRIKTK